jgi:hypothetical protein
LFLLFLSLGTQQICAANVNDSTANTIEIQDAVSTPRHQPAENNETLSVLLNNNTDTTTLTVKADTVPPVTSGITAGMESARVPQYIKQLLNK